MTIQDELAEAEQAAGVNVNLWTGLAMLLVGGVFIAWALMRPPTDEIAESEASGGRPGGD